MLCNNPFFHFKTLILIACCRADGIQKKYLGAATNWDNRLLGFMVPSDATSV